MEYSSISHCSRYYSDEYRFIKIRNISVEYHEHAGRDLVNNPKLLGIILKNLSLPSPDEVPLVHGIGLLADRLSSLGHTVSFYEYEPIDKSVDRTEELKSIVKHLDATKTPLLIVIPKLMSTVLASLAEDEGIPIYPLLSVTVKRDLVFYLPRTFVPILRFLVKRNSMASYRKYELMKDHALQLGFKVVKEKLFSGNGEILDYLEREVRSEGVNALFKNVPVTRLSLTVLATLRCLGKFDLVRRENIPSGETETFLIASTIPGSYLLKEIKPIFDSIIERYLNSNAYPKDMPQTTIIRNMVEGLESRVMDEMVRLYRAATINIG
ncbi:MAG: hypothetical protein GSR79_06255 [Desulfurococcales archaeon]|nr:hypothetical protein [Desulfurococcales archaeon]